MGWAVCFLMKNTRVIASLIIRDGVCLLKQSVQKNLPEQGFVTGHRSLKSCIKLCLHVQMCFSWRESLDFFRLSKGYMIPPNQSVWKVSSLACSFLPKALKLLLTLSENFP